MADDSDLEKTESPSSKRLEQAREEGQVPQSRELSSFLVVLTGTSTLWVMGEWMAMRIMDIIYQGFSFNRESAFDVKVLPAMFGTLGQDAFITLTPLLIVTFLAVFAAPFLLGTFIFSPKALQLDLNRLSPLSGIKKLISLSALGELIKGILKALIIGLVVYNVLKNDVDALLSLASQSLDDALGHMGHMLIVGALIMVSAMALIVVADVPFQFWHFYRRMRMTKDEVKREGKEMEGDPQVKARIRTMQREMAMKRMMAAVPKADVVVTNPTHFSVALKYDSALMRAPRVLAKGRGPIAQRIREIAEQHKVPLLEAPPLARALYVHTDVDDEVPAALYRAVAEVLAYVYQLNNYIAQGGNAPMPPVDLDVPTGFDPGPA